MNTYDEILNKIFEEQNTFGTVETSTLELLLNTIGQLSNEGIEKFIDDLNSKINYCKLDDNNIFSLIIDNIRDKYPFSKKQKTDILKINNFMKFIYENQSMPKSGDGQINQVWQQKTHLTPINHIYLNNIVSKVLPSAKTENEKRVEVSELIKKNHKNPISTSSMNDNDNEKKRESKKEIEQIEELSLQCSLNKDISKEINKIAFYIKDLVTTISKTQTSKNLIPTFSLIENIYKYFNKDERDVLSRFNKDIKLLCDHIEEKEYSKITENLLINIGSKLVKDIKSNPERNGKFLAWKLNKDLYLQGNSDTLYTQEDEEEDLYKLKNIAEFLDFESKKEKLDVIGGFNIFLTHILVERKDKKVNLSNSEISVRAEVQSHIITFFENFNSDDFIKLKKDLEGKSEKEFLDVILNKINNSSLVIPNKVKKNEYKKPEKIFTKQSNGKWFFSMMGSGKLDLHSSYNKKVVTVSTTTSDSNRFEESQLLLHPIKAKLLEKQASDILQKEININKSNKDGEWTIFDSKSIFYGLSIRKSDERKLELRIQDKKILENNQFLKDLLKDEYDDNLLENQFKSMDTFLLTTKIILEGNRFRKKKDNNEINDRLLGYRKAITNLSSLNNQETLTEYFRNNKAETEENKLTEEECSKILRNHIFDLQSLTMPTLNTQENELLLEIWLKKEFDYYEKEVAPSVNIKKIMFENIKLRNPLIRIDTATMYQNNKSEELVKFFIEILQNNKFENVYNINKNGLEEHTETIGILFENFKNKSGVNLESISKTFIKRILAKNKQNILLSAIIDYLYELKDKDLKLFEKIESNSLFLTNLEVIFHEVVGSTKQIKRKLPFRSKEERENNKKLLIQDEKNKLISKISHKLSTLEIDPLVGSKLITDVIAINNINELNKFNEYNKEILSKATKSRIKNKIK